MSGRRVLHITSMRSTKFGSLERYLLSVALSCKENGYDTIFQYEQIPHSESFRAQCENAGIPMLFEQTQGVGLLRLISSLNSIVRAARAEVIHAHFLNGRALFLLPLLARFYGAKTVIHTKHSIADIASAKRSKKIALKLVYSFYSRVLAVSDAVASDLRLTGVSTEKVCTHYLGLFGERERSYPLRTQIRSSFGIKDNEMLIGCIAFDIPFKGLDVLLEALAILGEQSSQVHLMIVGVDASRSPLYQLALELGVSSKVHWPGIKDDGWKLLNAADIYIQPSRFGEGLSLAIMEAMALGLPVIATSTAGNLEAVVDGKTGYACEPGNARALAATVQRAILDRARWSELGTEGRQRYEQMFQGSRSVERLVREHYQLVGHAVN